MRNTENYKFANCIIMSSDEYAIIMRELFDSKVYVEFGSAGIFVGYDDPTCEEPNVYTKLAEYFEVSEITDIHFDYVADKVWIAYKDLSPVIKATNIEWDVDDNPDALDWLPTEIEIPKYLEADSASYDEFIENVSDFLSDQTGYCHKGFVLE